MDDAMVNTDDEDLAVFLTQKMDSEGNVLEEQICGGVVAPHVYICEALADGWDDTDPDADGNWVDMTALCLVDITQPLMQRLLEELRRDEGMTSWEPQHLLDLMRLYRAGGLCEEDALFRSWLLQELPAKVEFERERLLRNPSLDDIAY